MKLFAGYVEHNHWKDGTGIYTLTNPVAVVAETYEDAIQIIRNGIVEKYHNAVFSMAGLVEVPTTMATLEIEIGSPIRNGRR